MDEISWANAMMYVASIPGTTEQEDKEDTIDINNLDKYI